MMIIAMMVVIVMATCVLLMVMMAVYVMVQLMRLQMMVMVGWVSAKRHRIYEHFLAVAEVSLSVFYLILFFSFLFFSQSTFACSLLGELENGVQTFFGSLMDEFYR